MTRTRSLAFTIALATVFALAGVGTPSSADPSLEPLVQHADWIANRPSAADLRGKVVVVDVFTFDCYNCRNVTPNLRALYERHDPHLAIIGIHTPETPYEALRGNVVSALASQGIAWPVAIDNNHALWDTYDNEYWPTQYVFDKHGALRATIVGDTQDASVDRTVDRLLEEK